MFMLKNSARAQFSGAERIDQRRCYFAVYSFCPRSYDGFCEPAILSFANTWYRDRCTMCVNTGTVFINSRRFRKSTSKMNRSRAHVPSVERPKPTTVEPALVVDKLNGLNINTSDPKSRARRSDKF